MKTNINVQICGDHWVNSDEVLAQLNNADNTQNIVLDMNTEGGSLYALGIADSLLTVCTQRHIDVKKVFIDNWPNSVEQIPFTRVYTPIVSHFFWLSENYWLQEIPTSTHEYRFGYFMGRKTPSRAVMLYKLNHQHSNDFLFSAMQTRGPMPWQVGMPGKYLEHLEDWLPANQHQSFNEWWNTCPVKSLDQRQVSDQYDSAYNTNRSLLEHYSKFDIELVAETYTLGTTFFPTEKTVRPIMAGRPMLVYGPRNFLENLQQLGFKTYADFWDESYDQFSGPERWHKIHQVIDTFLAMPNRDQLNAVKAMQQIANYNRQHLVNLIKRYRPT